MTGAELATLITRRVLVRAQEEPDPQEFIVRVLARLQVAQEDGLVGAAMEAELIALGKAFGLLSPELDTVN